MAGFCFDNTYARALEGAYARVQPARAPAPQLLYLNEALAAELRLDAPALRGEAGAECFAGNHLPDGAEPIAQAYAGHQFGGFSPQLGDGRALLLGELIDVHGRRRDLALKGSGRTPFSRGGDGKAAVGPMLREVLIGEAMHALGVPTTRALAVAATGDTVVRDRPLPGAVLARVAASHLRVGTLQYFAARGDLDLLRRVADHALARHDPDLDRACPPDPRGAPLPPDAARERYGRWFEAVARRQARLIAQWMNVGFIHGVMNTDNMALSGETIDYGPCAFLEAYDPQTVFSSIDHGGRYAYANQPLIARWNLARCAEALLPLMAAADDETEIQRAVAQVTATIDAFPAWYAAALLQGQRAKFGWASLATHEAAATASRPDAPAGSDGPDGDAALAADWLQLLHTQRMDFTLAWHHLADAAAGDDTPLLALGSEPTATLAWLARWRARCAQSDAAHCAQPRTATEHPNLRRARQMRQTNPWIIPRNHRMEEALDAATAGDLTPFDHLLAALRQPFGQAPEHARYAEPAPAEVAACHQTFCGT